MYGQGGARGWLEQVARGGRRRPRSHPVRRQARGPVERWLWHQIGRGFYASRAAPSRSATSLTTSRRAERLSLPGTIVQGAAAVLVRATISLIATV